MSNGVRTPQEQNISQLEENLAHIERLQRQLEAMRSTVSNLVRPLAASHRRNSTQVAQDTRNAASKAAEDMKKLRSDWSSEKTQAILAQAQVSCANKSDLSAATTTAEYGWADSP